MSKQEIFWIGHGSWKTVTNNGTVIYVDPWINGNPSAAIGMEDTMDAQIVCVTHGHIDHLGDAIEICKKSGAVLVCTTELGYYAQTQGIPFDDRGGTIEPGGSIRELDCTIRATLAMHNADIYNFETGMPILGSGAIGFIIEPDNGKSIYFAGDTGLFGDMKMYGDLYRPYVAVLPAGDKYLMGINEASYAAGLVGAPYVIPGHYNTFADNQQDMEEFKKLVRIRAPHTEPVVLKQGETFTF
ncbi:MAG: metal-dependent hydrolase [Eubacterium sp.]